MQNLSENVVVVSRLESDLATICTWFWGIPVTPMANLYSHFQGLDAKIEPAKEYAPKSLPALPIPPMIATQAQLGPLTATVEAMRDELEAFRREAREKAEHDALVRENLIKTIIDAGYGEVLKEKGVEDGIKAVLKKVGP